MQNILVNPTHKPFNWQEQTQIPLARSSWVTDYFTRDQEFLALTEEFTRFDRWGCPFVAIVQYGVHRDGSVRLNYSEYWEPTRRRTYWQLLRTGAYATATAEAFPHLTSIALLHLQSTPDAVAAVMAQIGKEGT